MAAIRRERAPKFFKIITEPRANKLIIPSEFTRRYGYNLPNSVMLKVPNGSFWEVEIIRCNGETWILNGWREFKEYYSISFGHLLVFEYTENSQFNVLIFDKTGSEIEYYDKGAHNINRTEDFRSESNDSDVDKRKNLKGIDSRMKDYARSTKHEKSTSDLDSQLEPKIKKQGTGSRLVKETSIAYQEAVAFKSQNPSGNPYFISLMHPSYVSKSSLNVPVTFAKENLPYNHKKLTLHSSNGKTWPIICNTRKDYAKFTSGWNEFVKDNALKVGDVCVFDAIKNAVQPLWDVVIFQS